MGNLAVPAIGTKLLRGDGAGTEVFTEIAEVMDISLSGEDASEIDVTDLGATDRRRRFKPGVIDPGNCEFTVNFVPGNSIHEALRTDQIAGTTRNWRIQFPTSPTKTWGFSGFVKSINWSMAPEETIKSSITIRISGAISEVA